MKKIMMVSYPRSGSGLILYTISRLIGYPNINGEENVYYRIESDEFSVIKEHDIDLSTNINPGIDYLVILRKNVIFNILAFMRYNHMANNPVSNVEEYISFQKKCSGMDLSKLDDDNTIINYYMYYMRFYNKWVLSNRDNVNVIYTEDIITHPEEIIKKLMKIVDKEDSDISSFTEELKLKTSFKPDVYNEQYHYIKNLIDNYDNFSKSDKTLINKVMEDWKEKNIYL